MIRALLTALLSLGVLVPGPADAGLSVGAAGAGNDRIRDLEKEATRRRDKALRPPAPGPGDASPPPGLAGQVLVPQGGLVALVLDPVRKRLYASDAKNKRVVVLATDTFAITHRLDVGGEPGALDIGPDGRYLWVALASGTEVAAVDLVSLAVAGRIDLPEPPATALAAGVNDRLFVGMEQADGTPLIQVYGVVFFPATDLGQLGGADEYLVGRSRDHTVIYAADDTAASVAKWAVSGAPAVADTADLFGDVMGDEVSPSSRIVHDAADTRLFVVGDGPANGGGRVPVHRRPDLLWSGELVAPDRVTAVAFAPAGDRIYVACDGETYLYAFSAVTFAEEARYPLGTKVVPHSLRADASGRLFCILDSNPGDDEPADRIGVIVP